MPRDFQYLAVVTFIKEGVWQQAGFLGWGTFLEFCGINSSQMVVKHTCGYNRRKPQVSLLMGTVVPVSPGTQETQPSSLQMLDLLRVGHLKAEGRAQCVHCCSPCLQKAT